MLIRDQDLGKRLIEGEAGQDRRAVLGLLLGVAGVAWTGTAVAQTCVDPKLAAATQGMRQALNYKDPSADPKKRCGLCAFFTAATPAACGKCAMLSGGPVSASAVCDSWTAKS